MDKPHKKFRKNVQKKVALEDPNNFFIVLEYSKSNMIEPLSRPSMKHQTAMVAMREAERLTKKHGKVFFVMTVLGKSSLVDQTEAVK